MATVEDIVRVINSHHRFLLTSHIHPDGDAIGSLLAMGFLLEHLGKEPILFTEDPVPAVYLSLPGVEKITHDLPALSTIEACFALDCGDSKRMGRLATQLTKVKPFVVIDHHLNYRTFADISWVSPESSAVGEMIYHLVRATGTDISYEIAVNLYVAIFTDTGSFRYASTSPQAMRIAAEMIDIGVRPSRISQMIYEHYSLNRLRLLSEVLTTLKTYFEGRVGLIRVSRDMLMSTHTSLADTEDFVNYPRSIAGVQLAAFIKEIENDAVSVSLRSRGDINAAHLAEKFGGGGHSKAAGFKRSGDCETVEQELLSEIGLLLENKARVSL